MKTAIKTIILTICFMLPVGMMAQVNNESDASGDDAGDFNSPLMETQMALGDSDTITVDFPNEEIRTVLRNVAELYMLNIVIPEDLQGTASIKLRDVSWRQIFDVVLTPVGFTYVEDGNIIQIISKETLNFEPPITDIFIINYANAADISGTVGNMVDSESGGRVQVDARTNSLIVTERASKMNGIRTVIERLDKPTQQVMIETKFVEVTNRDVENIGMNWASLNKFEGSIQYTDTTAAPLLAGEAVEPAFGGLKKLISSSNDGTPRVSNAIFSAPQFDFVLNLLQDQNDTRLVSNPTVVTMNNEEATISIGEEFPIPNYAYNEERGQFEVNGFTFKDIGVILKVKPSVNSNGLITLSVEPEVSSKTGESAFGEARIPIISTRKTSTQIALQDGYTMGLGGLMQSRDKNGVTKVPVLGDIPGIGRAFRNNNNEKDKLNLLIFITAKILPAESTNYQDVFTNEAIQAAGVDPEEMENR